ncbi:hypothetical protein [Pseudonocardia acidicola]|uniref:Uncharacterized protein n=1 Tax=Pseudonocardia acidicola TaxID=2724939 RepID=A0ABX1SA81_9PSEU|nr:hypothetical protein [Pseudonocardia acidicola]NMH98469.1 hypothetical protein [Pseudonocardia acidicola]
MAELPDRVRRKIDEIFGDVLPSVTRDEIGERGSTADDDGAAPSNEEWLRANRPPHHDRD